MDMKHLINRSGQTDIIRRTASCKLALIHDDYLISILKR